MGTDGKQIGIAGRSLQVGLAVVAIVVWRGLGAGVQGIYLATLTIGTVIGAIVGIQMHRPVSGTILGFCASVCGYALFWLWILDVMSRR
jgi:hypothetical protein